MGGEARLSHFIISHRLSLEKLSCIFLLQSSLQGSTSKYQDSIMKKKIVVKVHMACEKCRIKAKKIAASIEGVISIAVDGKDQDQLVVTGEGVDPVKLASKLRAKVGPTDVITVATQG